MKSLTTLFVTLATLAVLAITPLVTTVNADSAAEMQRDARAALNDLYASTPGAKVLGESAVGVLVFPGIVKGGFIVGGQYGEGVLFENNKATGYYSSAAASYGLQAGVQKFGYALFFMSKADMDYLNKSAGWEIGVGPTVTIADAGFANSITTTTTRKGVYAFFFEQRGLMAGLGLQGAKISKIHPKA